MYTSRYKFTAAMVSRMKTDLTQQQAQAAFHYDPETGVFTWRHRPDMLREWNTRFAGKRAGATMAHGYIMLRLNDSPYLAHRVAWLYVHGVWPAHQIDHINMVRGDNRMANLREATDAQNSMNRRTQSNNRSGYKGAKFHKHSGLWHARISAGGRVHSLGYFRTAKEAGEAYADAAKRLHGEFARTS